jgi:sialate O-acetylesterase
MKKVILIILIAVCNLLFPQSFKAEVKLPAIVSSNMVLQRNTTVVIWGWADANEKIIIKTSWLKDKITFKADKNGDWKIEVKTTNSKEAQFIKINSKKSDILLDNILFGEVWLCSGQSNMEQPLSGYNGQPTYEGLMTITKSYNKNLRIFNVAKIASKTPLKQIKKFSGWEQTSPKNVSKFSAVAYFFGQQLQEVLDCPVGMIHTSWGGSRVEAWMSKEVLNSYKKVNLENVNIKKSPQHKPTVLFNAMINPLIPYTIKGALWYQGESNRKQPNEYKKLFPAMVKDWRIRWEIGNFPFYYVQIAPYLYDNNNNAFQKNENSALIREAQLACLDLIPNSGIAITMDIGDENSIHPPKKKEVADRLLFNALYQTYGYKTLDYVGPTYTSLEIKEDGILLSFSNAEKGLYAYNGLTGFEIAGADKVFYPATAAIFKKKKVLVKSDKVTNPVAVRYAWRNWISGTLYDTNLLPASSFRTDNWNNATRSEK